MSNGLVDPSDRQIFLDRHFAKTRSDLDHRPSVEWFDETLEANHWASLNDVSPGDAAMLLCRFNPNAEKFDDVQDTTTDELAPVHLKQLQQRFEDLSKSSPTPRTLRDWHLAAKSMKVRYHSWIDEYMEATWIAPVAGSDTSEPEARAPVPIVDTIVTKQYQPTKKEGILLKRKALVSKYRPTWPDIESDLNHASENGLSDAAKGINFGDWFESSALAWAEQRGKRTSKKPEPASNSMYDLLGKKITKY